MGTYKLKIYYDEIPIFKSKFDKIDKINPILKKLKKKFGE